MSEPFQRARRAIDALRKPADPFARVPNTVRQSVADVIEDLLPTELDKEAQANARLIAEAPAMAELLERWGMYFQHYAAVVGKPEDADADVMTETRTLLSRIREETDD